MENSVFKTSSSYKRLLLIGHIEGVSFLILLFIAMPLKYFAGLPKAVSIVGMAHGVLFILFLAAIAQATVELKWNLKKPIIAFVASLIPLGTFYLDRYLKN